MTIRVATRYDIDVIVDMMREYSSYSPIYELRTQHNETHVRTILTAILVGAGRVWLAEKQENDKNISTGMLIAVRNPNPWNPDIIILSELAFWVREEYRGGTSAYRLWKAFDSYVEEQLDTGSIHGATLSRLHNSNFDPRKLGYRMIEQTYLKD